MRHVLGILLVAAMFAACDFGSDYVKYCQRTGNCDGGASSGDGGGGGDAGGVIPLGFTPSNVNPTGLDLSNLGDVDITQANCVIGTESVLLDCDDSNKTQFVTVTQSNQIKVGVYVARSWRIEPNASLAIQGTFPLVLIATDKIEVLGLLTAAGMNSTGIGGGYTQQTSNTRGGGPGGGGAGTTASAGGGGSYCGVGGAGAVESGSAAQGGAPYGSVQNTPLVGGSSGGDGDVGGAGAGGGAIQLVAKNSVTVFDGGAIHVGGGGGNFGGTNTQEAGGGGSGGAILLESPLVTVAGTLAANGGGGGQGGGGAALAGADATADNHPALGGNAPGPAGSFGGNGSAGAVFNGANGMDTAGNSAGAGGGGAGRIRINSNGGATLLGGTLSPDGTGPCMSQGALSP